MLCTHAERPPGLQSAEPRGGLIGILSIKLLDRALLWRQIVANPTVPVLEDQWQMADLRRSLPTSVRHSDSRQAATVPPSLAGYGASSDSPALRNSGSVVRSSARIIGPTRRRSTSHTRRAPAPIARLGPHQHRTLARAAQPPSGHPRPQTRTARSGQVVSITTASARPLGVEPSAPSPSGPGQLAVAPQPPPGPSWPRHGPAPRSPRLPGRPAVLPGR